MTAVYTRSEVAYLLALTEGQARELSEQLRSCAAAWEPHGQHSVSPSDAQALPLVLRWHDVHDARDRVRAALSAEHDRATQLRVNGHTEAEVAERLDTSEATARRRFVSTLDAILAALGGELLEGEASGGVSACLECGVRPRCRVVTYGLKLAGKPRPRRERQAALCAECLAAAAERTGGAEPEITTLIQTTKAAA